MVFEEDVAKLNLKNIIISSIMAALGFLVAFSWRDTIREAIDAIVPEGGGLLYMFGTSLLITILAVIIAFVLIKLSQRSIRETFFKTLKSRKKIVKKV